MIRKFRDLPEALLAKGCLDSAGVEAFLADDNTVRLDWFWSNAVGNIKLLVDKENSEQASSLLEQPIPEHLEVDGGEEYWQPRCPKCQSLDVSFEELHKPLAFGSAWVGLPLPIHRDGWICHSCRHQWMDENVEDPSRSTPPAP